MKAIEFTEAETGTTHARKIGKELRSAGYKQLGSGADATVWPIPMACLNACSRSIKITYRKIP